MTIAALPAAATLLGEVNPDPRGESADEVVAMRDAIDAVGLDDADRVVVVTAGSEPAIVAAPRVNLASYGYRDVDADLIHADDLESELTARARLVVRRCPRLDGELGVLALQAMARTDAPVLAITCGEASDGLARLAGALGHVVDATAQRVAIVVAGDLAATLTVHSPGYLVESAAEWDRRAVAGLRALDPQVLAALGPAEARRVRARGWAPLRMATSLARSAGRDRASVRYAAPFGVGQVVARLA